MKRFLKTAAVCLAAALFCTAVPVSADVMIKPDPWIKNDNFECGDNIVWSYDTDASTLTLTGSGRMWDFENYSAPWCSLTFLQHIVFDGDIESIGDRAFQNFVYLESIELPPHITRIGNCAFRECLMLKEINFPEELTEIGDNAFENTVIETVSLPDTVRSIGVSAFENSRRLVTFTMQEGIESIGGRCFADCPHLAEIRIPDSVTELGEGVLDGDVQWFQQQTEDFVIFGDGYLYRYFGSEPEVAVPEGVKHICADCFTKPVYAPTGYWESDGGSTNTIIREYKIRTDITSVTLPDSLIDLPEKLFYKMTGLQTLHLGKAVRTIPYGLCMNCTALSDLSLPDTVQEIGMNAFTENLWLEDAGDYVVLGDGLLYLYQGSSKVLTLPEGIRAVCPDAFGACNVVSVTFPESLQRLSEGSINGSALTEIVVNDGLTGIPAGAMNLPPCFLQITIPESVTEIDPDAFRYSNAFQICGKPGSAAEQFAAGKGLPFLSADAVQQGRDLSLDPGKDCWSFTNSVSVFGTQLYLNSADQSLAGKHGFKESGEWDGACFGMSVAVILAKNGLFRASQLDPSAAEIAELSPSLAVQSFINYYQYTQSAPEYRRNSSGGLYATIYRMIRTAQRVPNGASPFLICFRTASGDGHAVVGSSAETGSWHYMNRDWGCRIRIYDPNVIGFDEERFLYYDPETLAVCIPYYGVNYGGDAVTAGSEFSVYTDLGVMNAYPHVLAVRKGDLNSDGAVNKADAELLLHSLLTGEMLSAAAAPAAELSGDGCLNAVDLTLLKRMIYENSSAAE